MRVLRAWRFLVFLAALLLPVVTPQPAGAWQANANQTYSYYAPGPPGVGPGSYWCGVDTWNGSVFGFAVGQISSYYDGVYNFCESSQATVVYLVNNQLLAGPTVANLNYGAYKVTSTSISPTFGSLVGVSWAACTTLSYHPCVYWSTSPLG